jgi:hypothetical protein
MSDTVMEGLLVAVSKALAGSTTISKDALHQAMREIARGAAKEGESVEKAFVRCFVAPGAPGYQAFMAYQLAGAGTHIRKAAPAVGNVPTYDYRGTARQIDPGERHVSERPGTRTMVANRPVPKAPSGGGRSGSDTRARMTRSQQVAASIIAATMLGLAATRTRPTAMTSSSKWSIAT